MTALFSVEAKNIVITGGNGGIGSAIAAGLLELGANVIIMDFQHFDICNDLDFVHVDFLRQESIDPAVAHVTDRWSNVHGLVNCAGVTKSSSAESYSNSDWDETMEVNLKSVFQVCRAFGNRMIEQKDSASIVNVTSIGGHRGFPNNPAYVASKGGLRQLTKALSVDWGKHGIRVNNLVPGYTITQMNKKSWNDRSDRQERENRTSLGRWGRPNEFIGPAAFLLSDASSFVTGSDLVVDGGWLSKGL
jgi:NAD(P)-dependent dehydrogenase (short-subunit alcohol dehydrogenase family)